MTTPDVLEAATLKSLLAAMRAAGWRPSVTWEELGGRDADGAPWGPLCRRHTWRRGQQSINAWFEENGKLYLHILYDQFGLGDDFGDIVVGHCWVERMGVAGLLDLAQGLGVVPSAESRRAAAIGEVRRLCRQRSDALAGEVLDVLEKALHSDGSGQL